MDVFEAPRAPRGAATSAASTVVITTCLMASSFQHAAEAARYGYLSPYNLQQLRLPRQTSARAGWPSGPKPLCVSTHQ